MGKVRSGVVKSMAKRLLAMYGDRFTANFDENKRLVSELTTIKAKHLRNRVAGYITRLVKLRMRAEERKEEATSAAT